MAYTIALSSIPGVLNVQRNRKGKPMRYRSRQDAEWRAWLLLHDTPPHENRKPDGSVIIRHPYVEVRQGGETVLRWVKGRECAEVGTFLIHRYGKPGSWTGETPTK